MHFTVVSSCELSRPCDRPLGSDTIRCEPRMGVNGPNCLGRSVGNAGMDIYMLPPKCNFPQTETLVKNIFKYFILKYYLMFCILLIYCFEVKKP